MTKAHEKQVAAEQDDTEVRNQPDHLSDVPDGAGCTEIWEYLSNRRSGDE